MKIILSEFIFKPSTLCHPIFKYYYMHIFLVIIQNKNISPWLLSESGISVDFNRHPHLECVSHPLETFIRNYIRRQALFCLWVPTWDVSSRVLLWFIIYTRAQCDGVTCIFVPCASSFYLDVGILDMPQYRIYMWHNQVRFITVTVM